MQFVYFLLQRSSACCFFRLCTDNSHRALFFILYVAQVRVTDEQRLAHGQLSGTARNAATHPKPATECTVHTYHIILLFSRQRLLYGAKLETDGLFDARLVQRDAQHALGVAVEEASAQRHELRWRAEYVRQVGLRLD